MMDISRGVLRFMPFRNNCSLCWWDELLLVFASTVILGFGPRWDRWPYYWSFHDTCFEIGPSLGRGGSDCYHSQLVLSSRMCFILQCVEVEHGAEWHLMPYMTEGEPQKTGLLQGDEDNTCAHHIRILPNGFHEFMFNRQKIQEIKPRAKS
jgi:hypothetical protein